MLKHFDRATGVLGAASRRRGARRHLRLACLALLLAAPSIARAQVIVVDADGVPEADARRWRQRVEAALDGPATTFEASVLAREPVGTVPAPRLEVLSGIERLLVAAREARAQLRDREALLALGQALALAEAHLDVPGMAAWYAEVQLAIAVSAAQAGQPGVSEAALRRAASVDPRRQVQAAEARPELVRRARAIARAAATAPRGRFEVRAAADGAVVFVDDARVGPLPTTVEVPVGAHVIRVDAPGHRSWAQVISVFEGDRPGLDVALSPSSDLRAAHAAQAAAQAGELDRLVDALGRLEAAPVVYRVRPGAGPRDRALITVCRATGCVGPQLLEGEDGPRLNGPEAASRAEALRWLAEPSSVEIDEEPWWERWYFWVAAGAVAAAAAGAAAAIAIDQGQVDEPPLVILVDPGGLPVPGVD